MLNMADAIALSTTVVMAGTTVIAVIKAKGKANGNGSGCVTEKLCVERHGSLKEDIREVKNVQTDIFSEIKELRKDIQSARR